MDDQISTYAAQAKLDTHEKVCAERYASINQQLVTLHARLEAMSNRMWAAAGGAILVLLTAVGATVFALLTRGR
jgi:hypothetical protein